jgi:hypothetical protein
MCAGAKRGVGLPMQRGFNGFKSRISPISTTSGSSRRAARRRGKTLGIGTQPALVDHAVLVHVDEFDRVFTVRM